VHGNNSNDVFRPILPGIKELSYFRVYNRWGQVVFTTNEINKGWDGKINNILQPQGVFVWALKAISNKGKVLERKGTVLLIR
jgi:gliding motility-associated-like protein